MGRPGARPDGPRLQCGGLEIPSVTASLYEARVSGELGRGLRQRGGKTS